MVQSWTPRDNKVTAAAAAPRIISNPEAGWVASNWVSPGVCAAEDAAATGADDLPGADEILPDGTAAIFPEGVGLAGAPAALAGSGLRLTVACGVGCWRGGGRVIFCVSLLGSSSEAPDGAGAGIATDGEGFGAATPATAAPTGLAAAGAGIFIETVGGDGTAPTAGLSPGADGGLTTPDGAAAMGFTTPDATGAAGGLIPAGASGRTTPEGTAATGLTTPEGTAAPGSLIPAGATGFTTPEGTTETGLTTAEGTAAGLSGTGLGGRGILVTPTGIGFGGTTGPVSGRMIRSVS